MENTKQDAESVGSHKYNLGDIVVVDFSIDHSAGIIVELKPNGWYVVKEFFPFPNALDKSGTISAREDWLKTWDEFEEWRNNASSKK